MVTRMLDLNRNERRELFRFATRKNKVSSLQVRSALKTYASALLIMLGNNKEALLSQTEMSEADWIKFWCRVLEYTPEDMQVFDQVMIPAYQKGAVDGLLKAALKQFVGILFPEGKGTADKKKLLRDALVKDLTAILRFTKSEQVSNVSD